MIFLSALLSTGLLAAAAPYPDAARLAGMAARFVPSKLTADVSTLSAGDRTALRKLVEASRIIDDVFMDQYWSGNRELWSRLRGDASPLGREQSHYFWINKSPWSELDHEEAFLPGVPSRKLPGANFYPEDMTKDEFEAWTKALPPGEREKAVGFYSVIRRDSQGKLRIVGYSTEFRRDLERTAALLTEAARATGNASLKKFLQLRAEAFLSDDYFASDVAWMDLDAPIDVTIGPYETYNDGIFGYKAAFEAYVNLRDDAETARVAFYSRHLQAIEDHLPEEPKYRTRKLGALAPIRVVNEVFGAGDGNHGVQTAAYNLPNDDRVVAQKGSKRVLLKNIQEAKFHSILEPIARKVLSPAAQRDISFDAFFTHILAHELTHGLGPHEIRVADRSTNPRLEIKELFGAIEEAKADVTGLFALQYLMNEKVLPGGPDAERRLYTTYLASAFRTLRFGPEEAHGKGMAVQLNFLLDRGGFRAEPDGTFSVDLEKVKSAVADLDRLFLTLEATGDYAGAKKLLSEMGGIRPPVAAAIEKLKDIPTDIEPVFTTAEEIAPETPRGKPKVRYPRPRPSNPANE